MFQLHVDHILIGQKIGTQPIAIDVVVAGAKSLKEFVEVLFYVDGSLRCSGVFIACQDLCGVDPALVEACCHRHDRY